MFVRLVLAGGKKAGTIAEIKEGFYLIGRDGECQIRPESPSVSERHCLLQHADKYFRVFVLDDDSPTLVNHQPLKPKTWVILNHGDMLQVGRVPFMVVITATDPSLPASASSPAAAPAKSSKPQPSKQPDRGDDQHHAEFETDDFAMRDTAEIDAEAVQEALSRPQQEPQGTDKASDRASSERWKNPPKQAKSQQPKKTPGDNPAAQRAAESAASSQRKTASTGFRLPHVEWKLLLAVGLVIAAVGLGAFGAYHFFYGSSSQQQVLPDID